MAFRTTRTNLVSVVASLQPDGLRLDLHDSFRMRVSRRRVRFRF